MINKTLFRVSLTGKLFLALFLLSGFSVSAQEISDSTTKQEQGSMEDLPAKPFRMPSLTDVGGSSPFLSEEYRQGSVELGQGRVVNNVPIKFNTFNNAIMDVTAVRHP